MFKLVDDIHFLSLYLYFFKEEKQLFLERLKKVGADGQWGLFSIGIPGRVGYQCSNYYRSLLKSGELTDSNYVIDSKTGAVRYLFQTKTDEGRVGK